MLSVCPALLGRDLLEEVKPIGADAAADLDVVVANPACPLERRVRARCATALRISPKAQRRLIAVGRVAPESIDRSFEGGVGSARGKRKRHAVSRGRADARGAAHLHGADRVRRVVHRPQTDDLEGVRQLGLVDDEDLALLFPDRR